MKPADLKAPFKWVDRKLLLKDKILFAPKLLNNNESFIFPPWSHEEVFGNDNPVRIEYCSGNGAWIAAKALEEPNVNWVAIERKFDRVKKIWSKRENFQLKNLFIICGEGFFVTEKFLPSKSAQEIFVNFPDPWPKKRHWKNRIIKKPMVVEFSRLLKDHGILNLVTDDEGYSKVMIDEVHSSLKFSSKIPEPFFTHDCPTYGSSYFEDLWRAQGKQIRYHHFIKL